MIQCEIFLSGADSYVLMSEYCPTSYRIRKYGFK